MFRKKKKEDENYEKMIESMIDYISEGQNPPSLSYVALKCKTALAYSISNKDNIQKAYDKFVNYLDDKTKKKFIIISELITIDMNKEN